MEGNLEFNFRLKLNYAPKVNAAWKPREYPGLERKWKSIEWEFNSKVAEAQLGSNGIEFPSGESIWIWIRILKKGIECCPEGQRDWIGIKGIECLPWRSNKVKIKCILYNLPYHHITI